MMLLRTTKETSFYAGNYIVDKSAAPAATSRLWPGGITVNRMWIFMALQYYMGLVKNSVIRDYWVTESIMSTPFPSSLMSRNEFFNIMKFLHLFDNDEYLPRGEPGYGPDKSWVYFIPLFKNHLQVFGHAGKDCLWMKGQFLIRAVYISNVSTHLNLTNTILKPSRCVIPQMGTATVLTFMLVKKGMIFPHLGKFMIQ